MPKTSGTLKKHWAVALALLMSSSPLAAIHFALAQNINVPSIQWEKYYSEAYPYDAIDFIVQSNDGGYVLLAPNNHYSGFSFLPASATLLKIDKSGNVEWDRQFNESSTNDFAAVGGLAQTSDQGYVFANGRNDGVDLIKIDSIGNIEWNYTFPHNGYGISMVHTSDGGFAIAGTEEGTHNLSSLWLIKTNSEGKLSWTKTFQNQLAGLSQMIQAKNGDFIVLGYTYNASTTIISTNAADLLMLKISPSGSLLWSKTYDSGESTWGNKAIVQTSDGGYILTNNTGIATVIKTNSNGGVQWTKTYNVSSNYPSNVFTGATLNSVILTSDGGLAFAGTASFGEVWLLKTDTQGTVEWNQTYGDRDQYGYQAYSLLEANDGSLLVGGEWQQMSHGDHYYLLKTQPFLTQPTASPEPTVTLNPPEKSGLFLQFVLPIAIVVAIGLIAIIIILF